MTVFSLQKHGELQYLTFNLFYNTGIVAHAFTSRHGGVSEGNYATLNMSLTTADNHERVIANRLTVCRSLNKRLEDLVACEQSHGDFISVVDSRDKGRGAWSVEDSLPATDALLTGEKGLLLSTYHADCVPVFLLDPVRMVIGLVHAGWRGTCLQITKKTIHMMQKIYGSRPENCLAGIGPAIGPCCYIVDEPVIARIKTAFFYWEELITPVDKGHWRLNLWEANRRMLLDAGLKPGHVSMAGLCTFCRDDLFFSYRAADGPTGRMAALISLL